MTDRKLVFVPLHGEEKVDDWTKVKHLKLWGLRDRDSASVFVLYIDGKDESLYQGGVYTAGHSHIFPAEWEHAQEIDPKDAPDEVAIALAKLALMGGAVTNE